MDDNRMYFFILHNAKNCLKPEVKRRYRHSIKAKNNDPLATSLRDHKWKDFWLCGTDPWRRVYRDDWDSWYEYVIMPDFEEESDEEMQRNIDELRVEINSPYDCTGKPFTNFIRWKRTKAGVVIVRHMSLDI